jgi:hypothetical protein
MNKTHYQEDFMEFKPSYLEALKIIENDIMAEMRKCCEYKPSEIHSRMVMKGYDEFKVNDALSRMVANGEILVNSNLKIKRVE